MKKLIFIISLVILSIASPAFAINTTVPEAPAAGAILYGKSNGLYTTLSPGSEGSCLGISGGLPAYITCATATTTSGSAYPFTTTTNFGVTNSATGTPIWAQGGVNASSSVNTSGVFTSYGTGTSTFPNAQITNLRLGSDYITDLTGSNLTVVNGALTVKSVVQVINVKDPPYNAVGDGVVDDNAAIQAAYAVQQNASTTGCMYFPPGQYNITAKLAAGVKMCAIGYSGSSNFQKDDPDKYVSRIRMVTNNTPIIEIQQDGDKLENLTFQYATRQGLSDTEAKAIVLLTGSVDARLNNLSFQDVGYALYSQGGEAWQADIQNIHVSSYSQKCMHHISSATPITINQFYCQNSELPVQNSTQINGLSKTGNLITLTALSDPSTKYQLGNMLTILNFAPSYINTLYPLHATTSSTIVVKATSTDPLPTITDAVGNVLLAAGLATGPAFDLQGIFDIRGLDIEQTRLQSDSVFRLQGGTAEVSLAHYEGVYSTSSEISYWKTTGSSNLNVGTFEFINMGCAQGQTCYVANNDNVQSKIKIDAIVTRDYSQEFSNGLRFDKATGADDVILGSYNVITSNRAGSNPTPASYDNVSKPLYGRFATSTINGVASTSRLVLDNSLRIGTTSDSAMISLATSTGNPILRMNRTTGSYLEFGFNGGYSNFITNVAFNITSSFTDNTNKATQLTLGHYNSSGEEPTCGLVGGIGNGSNTVGLGGGGAGCNAATTLNLYTAADSTTLVGSARATLLGSTGNFGIGTTSPYARLSVAGGVVADNYTATSTTATSTFPNLSATNVNFNGDYITDFTGSGLSIVNGALTASGGTGFSTTSADYWLTQNQGTAFSTTSADAWDVTKSRWATTSDSFAFDTRLAATTTLNNLTTLQGLTDIISTRATTTNATSTNFFATTASTTNLFAGSGVSVGTTSTTGRITIGTDSGSAYFIAQRTGSSRLALSFAGAQAGFESSSIFTFSPGFTDGTNKTSSLGFNGYNASTDGATCFMTGTNSSADNQILWGGGVSGCDSTMVHRFYTATTSTTTSGTLALTIGSTGNVTIGTGSEGTEKLTVKGNVFTHGTETASNFTATSTAVNTLPVLLATNATSTNLFSTTASSTNSYTTKLSVGTTSQQAAITAQVLSGQEALFLGRTGTANNLAVTFEGGRTNFKSASGFFNLTNAFNVGQTKQGLITIGNYEDGTYAPRCFGGATDNGVFGPVYLGGGFPECLAATSLDFYTADNASSTVGNLVMRILGGGNVGIGVSVPTDKLVIAGTTTAQNFVATSTTATSTLPNANITRLQMGSDIVTDLTGSGITIVNGALTAAGGSNFLTNSGSNTYLNTGTNLQAPTLEATSTASSTLPYVIGGDISLNNIFAKTSAGLDIHSLNGGIVANLGVGSSQNSLFYGGVNIDGATRLATSLNGAVQATAGAITAGTLPVASGGTGATSFGQGWIYGSGDGIALAASTSPTVNYITATSTTGTNTFAGSLQVNGGTLFVDAVNNRVSVSSTSPSSRFTVSGQTHLDGFTMVGSTSPFISAIPANELIHATKNVDGYMGALTCINRSTGTTASCDILFNNNLTDFAGGKYFADISYAGGNNADPLYTSMGANSLSIINSDGAIVNVIATTSATATHDWVTGSYLSPGLKMRLTQGGNLGIGTSTPLGMLSVSTASTSSTIPSFVVGSSTRTDFLINGVTGNIAIGTTTTNRAKIHISNYLNQPSLYLDGGLGGADMFRFVRPDVNGGSGNYGLALKIQLSNPSFLFRSGMSASTEGTSVNGFTHISSTNSFMMSTTTSVTGVFTGLEPMYMTNSNSNIGFAGTTTPWGSVSINGVYQSAGEPTFVIGSSTKTDFIVTQGGLTGVGTTSPWRTFAVNGTVAMRSLTTAAGTPNSVCINSATKEVTENAATTCVVSDEDQKTPLQPLTFSALDMVNEIQPSSFSYKDNLERTRYGFGAQSLQKIDNQLGDAFDKDGVARSIDIPALIAVNTKAIQELDDKVDAINGGEESDSHTLLWIAIGILAIGLGVSQYQIYKLKK